MGFFTKYRWLLVALTAVAVAISVIFSVLKPIEYDSSISFSINRINQQPTEDYQYDGYYAIQASDLFSQTVMSWMMTPSVLLEIYERAGIDPMITSIERFTSRFKTNKYSPQNIVVRFSERDRETAEKIARAIIEIIEEKGAVANQTSEQEAFFVVDGATPVIVEQRANWWLNGLLSLVGGFLISLAAAYIIEYLRRDAQGAQNG
ncbi:MAG: hypothetical protein WC505_07460 [Patescibacteria group bacterium]